MTYVKKIQKEIYSNKYNCGGYALRTFNWYLPFNQEKEFWNINAIDRHVKYMLKNFDGRLRLIEKEEDALLNERVIFFRGSRYDFHFIIKGKNGNYYHKPGGWEVEEISREEIYEEVWLNRYYSKMFVMALKLR